MKTEQVENSVSIRVVAFASGIGATIEWYDFFLYGVVTPLVFNKLFFPNFDPIVGTLLAYTTFFVGFVSRPIGGIIFGHYGDRIGRKGVLILTLLIMGVATFLIGLLPTYESVGIWAPLRDAALKLGLRFHRYAEVRQLVLDGRVGKPLQERGPVVRNLGLGQGQVKIRAAIGVQGAAAEAGAFFDAVTAGRMRSESGANKRQQKKQFDCKAGHA